LQRYCFLWNYSKKTNYKFVTTYKQSNLDKKAIFCYTFARKISFFYMDNKEEITAFSLEKYLNTGVKNLMATAYRAAVSNPKELFFVLNMKRVFTRSEKRRKALLKEENLHIPPFLISSIATACNLSCAGCYARANRIEQTEQLPVTQWKIIFEEAAQLGVVFNLLAGGEPLMRREVLEEAAKIREMIFPVFTNGLLLNEMYLNFFADNLNIIPVISVEGGELQTDKRRGSGVFKQLESIMERLRQRNLFYGISITVTTENQNIVTSDEYVEKIKTMGYKIVFYVEYVPVETETAYLALDATDITRMATTMERVRQKYGDILFLSFPGDEKEAGGCLAAGRGFLHISPSGKAEACPFAPFSDINIAESGLKAALRSPFFEKLRTAGLVGGEHTGGCALFERQQEVKYLLNN
jgi:MoaA/NifB/PqqE/SkfB family radical SAM enzyme